MNEKIDKEKDCLILNPRLYIALTIVMYIGYFGVLILFMHEKTNYHMDEITVYVAANNALDNSVSINPKYNKKYTDASEPYMPQMTVSEGQSRKTKCHRQI